MLGFELNTKFQRSSKVYHKENFPIRSFASGNMAEARMPAIGEFNASFSD